MPASTNILPVNSLNDLRPEKRQSKDAQIAAHKQAVATIQSFEDYLMAIAERSQNDTPARHSGMGRSNPVPVQDIAMLQHGRRSLFA